MTRTPVNSSTLQTLGELRNRLKTRWSQHMREAANLLRGEGEKLGAQLSLWR